MAGGAARFCNGMCQLVILINMSVIGQNPSRDKKASDDLGSYRESDKRKGSHNGNRCSCLCD